MSGRSRFAIPVIAAVTGLLTAMAEALAHNGVDHTAGATSSVPGANTLGLLIIVFAASAIARHLWPRKSARAHGDGAQHG